MHFALIVLVAIGLTENTPRLDPQRAEPREQTQQTNQPELSLWCWADDEGRWCYTVGCDEFASRPKYWTHDIWSGWQVHEDWRFDPVYRVPLWAMRRAAWEREVGRVRGVKRIWIEGQ